MIRKILSSKEPSLRQKSKPIGKIDKKTKDLIKDLWDTLEVQKDPEGVGLAAPQIGKNVRLFVASYKDFRKVVINPEIISISESKTKNRMAKSNREILEGCLSLPNYYGPLKRAKSVKIKYLNENGQEVVETFEGFNAQIILHEIDHLEGVLFLDRLLEQKGKLYKATNDEWEEVDI